MHNKHPHLALAVLLAGQLPASAQFWVDFNSSQNSGGTPVFEDPTDPANATHHHPDYLCYHASHETPTEFLPAIYDVSFAGTGAAMVTMTPEWPNTTGANVQQSIGRSDGQAATWIGKDVNLLRDWIGADSRTGNSGNGAWDGTTGTPTYFQLRFEGLPQSTYEMTAFMHDVEHMTADFSLEISNDGGTTFGEPILGRMTNSQAGGTPAENEVLSGTEPNVENGDPLDLTSTQVFTFEAMAGQDVVLRFAPFSNGSQVHREFVGLNGFKMVQSGPAGPGLQVTEVLRDANSGEVSLTWSSREGATYTIRSSSDLTGDPAEWDVVETGFESEGEETTFVDSTATGDRLFYVVEQE